MTATEFGQYLSRPELLSDLPLSDLERLVEAHPYCAPLRLLRLKKYQQEGLGLFGASLPREAAYAADRRRLQDFLYNRADSPQPLHPADIKFAFVSENPPSISARELGLEKKTLILNDLSMSIDQYKLGDVESDAALLIMPKKNKKLQNTNKEAREGRKKRFQLPHIPILDDEAVREMFPTKEDGGYILEEDPTAEINDVDGAFAFLTLTEDFLRSITQRMQGEPQDSQEQARELEQLTEASVSENEDIASETLAQLLLSQGQVQKAIKMYQRLQAQHPAHADYYAQQIAAAKNKK